MENADLENARLENARLENVWQLQEAKSRFSELVDRTLKEGAQIVTRHGEKTVVVIPYEEYDRMTRPKESLSAFLLNSPLAGADFTIERDPSLPRAVNLEP